MFLAEGETVCTLRVFFFLPPQKGRLPSDIEITSKEMLCLLKVFPCPKINIGLGPHQLLFLKLQQLRAQLLRKAHL
jgi:hypothetical protein